MTNKKKLEKIHDILDLIVDDFFRRGEMPLESAYAWSVVARAFVAELMGTDGAKEYIAGLRMHPDCYRNVVPENETLEKLLLGIFELRGVVGDSLDNRDSVIFTHEAREGSVKHIDHKPDLHLVPSAQKTLET